MSKRIGLAAVTALAAVAIVTGPAAKTAPIAQSESQWQVFQGAKVDEGRPLLGLTWAVNRVWIIAPHGEVATLASARVSGRRLTSFAATRVPGGAFQYVPIVDGELVLEANDRPVTAPLLANGRLGASTAVADDLLARAKEAIPRLDGVSISDRLRSGGRVVWALDGYEKAGTGSRAFFLVCCDETGAATDLTQFVDRRVGATSSQLGLDARGRVWLAWLDRGNYSGAMRGYPRVLELDPSTLAPQTKAVAAPGLVTDRVELACAASCRTVAQSASGDIVSWAPGEHAPSLAVRHVVSLNRVYTFPRELLAATSTAGGFLIAYRGQTGEEKPLEVIGVVRIDARGAHPRAVATVATAYGWPPGKLYPPFSDPVAYGTFVRRGLVALEHFRYGNSASPVVYAFLPIGR